MYIKAENIIGDADLFFVGEFLEHLDVKFLEIRTKIFSSPDPDSVGLLDQGEYYIGVGFSVAQRYIASTYPQLNISKGDALKSGPKVRSGLTFIEALNAGANYWKHQEEWGVENIISKDIESLPKQAQNTIRTIEILTPWADYTCSNILSELVAKDDFKLSALLPSLEEWRNDLDRKFT